jgi:hypothetical protein
MTLQRLLNVRWHIEHPIAPRGHFYIPMSRVYAGLIGFAESAFLRSWPRSPRRSWHCTVGVKVFICSVARLPARAPHCNEGKQWTAPRTWDSGRYRFASTLTPHGMAKTQRGAAVRRVERCAVTTKQPHHYDLHTGFRAGLAGAARRG